MEAYYVFLLLFFCIHWVGFNQSIKLQDGYLDQKLSVPESKKR